MHRGIDDPDLKPFAERAMGFLALARHGGAEEREPVGGGAAGAPAGTDALPDEALSVEPLAGDGSTRRIYRARLAGLSAVVVRNPLPPGRPRPDENDGFLAIREFLDRRGVRVPAFYVADLERGSLLLEDLGDERLYDRVRRVGWVPEGEPAAPGGSRGRLLPWYEQAIRHLVLMQQPASPAFDLALAPNPAYTEELVLAAEARYFHEELVRGHKRRDSNFGDIEPDCRRLAREALSGPAAVFVHRDYQSRNLMISGRTLAVIDFQGARLAPPEYDLASLLYDPYVAMPEAIREALVLDYLREASGLRVPGVPPGPEAAWRRRFLANAANRLMQALGAFAKLGGRLGRTGFLEHVPDGLRSLEEVLQEHGGCPALGRAVRDLRAPA